MAAIRTEPLDANNLEICAATRQVLDRIRSRDQKTTALINRRLGNSIVLSQVNTDFLFLFWDANLTPARVSLENG